MRKFTVIGYGKLGKALSMNLLKKGKLHSIVSKHLSSTDDVKIFEAENVPIYTDIQENVFESDVFLISTKEIEIRSVVNKIINNFSDKVKGKIFLHHAGIYGKEILADLHQAGGYISSVHPLQTFYFPKENLFDNIYWIVDSDETTIITEVIKDIGGNAVFWSGDEKKRGFYHSAAVASSNAVGSILFFVKQILIEIGLPPKILLPLIHQTIENYFSIGDELSFPLTGPIARKNFEIIEKHLNAFKPYPDKLTIYCDLIDLLIKISHHFSVINKDEKEKFIQNIKDFIKLNCS